MDIELIVLAYNQETKAREVLKTLRELQRNGTISILNAAILTKNKKGKTSLTETEDVDAKHGALFGAITGGLVGLLGGPGGAIVGAAAGAATGGVAAHSIDMGFANESLHELEQSLQPGSSAIVALVEQHWADQLAAAAAEYGGQLFREALKDEIAAQLAATSGEESGIEDPTAQDKLEVQLKELRAHITELKAQVAKAGAEAKADLDQQIADLRSRRDAAWDELGALLEAQSVAMGAEIEELKTQATNANTQAKTNYEQRIAALRAEQTRMLAKLQSTTEAQLQEWNTEIEELKAKAAQAQSEAKADLDEQIAALTSKYEATRVKLYTQAQAQLQALETQITDLEARAEQAGTEAKDDIDNRITALRTKLHESQAKLRVQLEADLRKMEAEIAVLEASADKAGAETKAELNEQITVLRARWHATQDELRVQLEADLRETEAAIKELEAEAAEAKAETKADLDKQIAALRGKYAATQDRLRAHREAQVEAWQAEIEALKAEALANKSKFAAGYYGQMERLLQNAEDDIAELKAHAAAAGEEDTAEYNKRAAALIAKQAKAQEKLRAIKSTGNRK